MYRSRFGRWLRENEVLAWIGVGLGLASLFVSPVFGWTTFIGGTLFVFGGVLLGALVVGVYLAPPRYQLHCLNCEVNYELHGVRGCLARRVQTVRLKAMADLLTFPYAMRKQDGQPGPEVIKYRNIGRNGTDVAWLRLSADQLMFSQSPADYTTVTIKPPHPIKRGDVIEVMADVTISDAFPKDTEYVGKNILFPTDALALKISFDGCPIENLLGTRFELTPIEGQPLQQTSEGGKNMTRWQLQACKVGETYRISWSWV